MFKGLHHAAPSSIPRLTACSFATQGDGFLVDVICLTRGHTYSFCFRHQDAPKLPEIFKQFDLSPLHQRCIHLLLTLIEPWTWVWFDNYYNSVKFCIAADVARQHVGGITRKGGRGVPDCVKLGFGDASTRKQLEKVRGKTQVAVLTGNDLCPDVVAVGLGDQKVIFWVGTLASTVHWITKTRPAWSNALMTFITINFLRLNIIDDYNGSKWTGMGLVDIGDQLRNVYRMMQAAPKSKWWWALMMWGFGVALTDAYILYMMLTDKEDHCHFIRGVTLALIAPEQYDPAAMSKNASAADVDADTVDEANAESTDCLFDDGQAPDSPKKKRRGSCIITEKQVKDNNLSFRVRNVGVHLPTITEDPSKPKGEQFRAKCQVCQSKWMFSIKTGLSAEDDKKYRKLGGEYDKLKKRAKAKVATRSSVHHCAGCNMNICIGCWHDWRCPNSDDEN